MAIYAKYMYFKPLHTEALGKTVVLFSTLLYKFYPQIKIEICKSLTARSCFDRSCLRLRKL